MKIITTFIVGMTVGVSLGYVLATQAGDYSHDLNQQYQQEYNTRNAIQFYDFQQRPSTAIPFDGPS